MAIVPKSEESFHNSTFVTPTLSDADTLTMNVPLTVWPSVGEVMEVVGGMVSGPLIVKFPVAELVYEVLEALVNVKVIGYVPDGALAAGVTHTCPLIVWPGESIPVEGALHLYEAHAGQMSHPVIRVGLKLNVERAHVGESLFVTLNKK